MCWKRMRVWQIKATPRAPSASATKKQLFCFVFFYLLDGWDRWQDWNDAEKHLFALT